MDVGRGDMKGFVKSWGIINGAIKNYKIKRVHEVGFSPTLEIKKGKMILSFKQDKGI